MGSFLNDLEPKCTLDWLTSPDCLKNITDMNTLLDLPPLFGGDACPSSSWDEFLLETIEEGSVVTSPCRSPDHCAFSSLDLSCPPPPPAKAPVPIAPACFFPAAAVQSEERRY